MPGSWLSWPPSVTRVQPGVVETPTGSLQVSWSPVTEPDERERCCVVVDGKRCELPSAFRIASEDGALDGHTYTCKRHLHLVNGPGYVVTAVES
jgi:hypothetical protein